MKVYRATVRPGRRFLLVTVEGVGTTQARNLAEVDEMARDLVATLLDIAPDSFDLETSYELPDSVKRRLDRAAAFREKAAKAQASAVSESRAAAKELVDSGLSLRDVGRLLGLSFQRIHQLVKRPRA